MGSFLVSVPPALPLVQPEQTHTVVYLCVLLRVWSEWENKARFCCVEIYGEVLKEDHLRRGQMSDKDALGSIKKKKKQQQLTFTSI